MNFLNHRVRWAKAQTLVRLFNQNSICFRTCYGGTYEQMSLDKPFCQNHTQNIYTQFNRQCRKFSGHREIPVPNMAESITEGTLNSWKKAVGEYVEADEVIAVIDTDKVSLDINSPVGGEVVELKASEGDTVFVGNPLFILNTEATPPERAEAAPPPPPQLPKEEVKESRAPTEQKAPAANKPKETSVAKAPKESPPAQKPSKPASKTLDYAGTEKRVPMTRMRIRIAERLKGAQNSAAMLTTFNECDMGNLMAMRSDMNEEFQKVHGVKMGFVSAFLLASAKALKKIPEVNAYIENNDIVYKQNADISVAVATPTGLMVPVIKNCDTKSWAELEMDLADLAQRARNNKIALEEMVGGTFTISNGGVYGSMMGTPILNPPQSSILGMHATVKRPVVRGNDIVIRPIMYLALTYDHRLIDGREAVLFLCAIRDYIEDPRKMLLDL